MSLNWIERKLREAWAGLEEHRLVVMAFFVWVAFVAWLFRSFPPGNDIQRMANLVEMAAVAAGLIGGVWALYQYGYERRVRSGDVLLELYKDLRSYLPSLGQIEDDNGYEDIKSLLERALKKELELKDWEPIKEIDGMLRHFLLLHCLDASRQIDRKIIHVNYRYYARLLMRDERIAMRIYVHRYFATLAGFLEDPDIFPDDGHSFPRRKILRQEVDEKMKTFREEKISGEDLVVYFNGRVAGKISPPAETP